MVLGSFRLISFSDVINFVWAYNYVQTIILERLEEKDKCLKVTENGSLRHVCEFEATASKTFYNSSFVKRLSTFWRLPFFLTVFWIFETIYEQNDWTHIKNEYIILNICLVYLVQYISKIRVESNAQWLNM